MGSGLPPSMLEVCHCIDMKYSNGNTKLSAYKKEGLTLMLFKNSALKQTLMDGTPFGAPLAPAFSLRRQINGEVIPDQAMGALLFL